MHQCLKLTGLVPYPLESLIWGEQHWVLQSGTVWGLIHCQRKVPALQPRSP